MILLPQQFQLLFYHLIAGWLTGFSYQFEHAIKMQFKKKVTRNLIDFIWVTCCTLMFYYGLFLLNGGVSIISKLHQIEQGFETVNSDCFVLFTSLIKCIALLPVFFVLKKKSPVAFKPDIKKILPVIVLASVFSGVSYMLQLIGATSLPATVVYPLITGGSIILSSVAGLLILKEKPSKQQITGILICFIGTCLFL